jgi:site-specific DNA-cytosine methylase
MTVLDVIALSPLIAGCGYGVYALAAFALRARRRRRRTAVVTGEPLVRAIRESYDGLPYSHPSAPDPLLGVFPCTPHSVAGPRRSSWDS